MVAVPVQTDIVATCFGGAGDQTAPPLKKFGYDALARKIHQNSHVVLSAEDIATIKERIGKAFGAPQIGATWPLLDPSINSAQ